jgi:hypothetical protein
VGLAGQPGFAPAAWPTLARTSHVHPSWKDRKSQRRLICPAQPLYDWDMAQDADRQARDMHALRRQGWTLQRIADKYGVTKQAVQQLLKRRGLSGGRGS